MSAPVVTEVQVVPMADLSASLHTRYVDGEEAVDYVVILRPRSDAAYEGLGVMLKLVSKGKGAALIKSVGKGGAEIIVRTKPHWRHA